MSRPNCSPVGEASRPLAFLDANVLAKPLTRSLIVYARDASGYRIGWSRYVEDQADRHLDARKAPVGVVRAAAGIELTPQGSAAESFAGTAEGDRQVLADAVAAGAAFLVTEDVDDFGEADLDSAGVSAVNPDLFLTVAATTDAYRAAVELMAAGMADPERTPEELHRRLGRQHPLAVAAHGSAFALEPEAPTHSPPAALFRGSRCLRCGQAASRLARGLCGACDDLRPDGHPGLRAQSPLCPALSGRCRPARPWPPGGRLGWQSCQSYRIDLALAV
jgi:hypothetical protein